MAIEPERPIEQMLRASAKKRRDEAGAPLELHPATRRLLQGEVARTFARDKRQPEAAAARRPGPWSRFAWAAAIFAVLLLAALVLVPGLKQGRQEAQFARNESLPEAGVTKQFAPQPAAVPPSAPPGNAPPAPSPLLKDSDRAPAGQSQPARQLAADLADRAKARKEEMAGATAAASVEPPAASPSKDSKQAAETSVAPTGQTLAAPAAPAEAGAFKRRYGLEGSGYGPAPAPGAPTSPAPLVATPAATDKAVAADQLRQAAAPIESPVEFAYKAPAPAASASRTVPSTPAAKDFSDYFGGGLPEGSRLGLSQRFAQVAQDQKTKAGSGKGAPPAQAVLASFQVEQSGSELRITDGDGSVYSGFVRSAEEVGQLQPTGGEQAAAARTRRASPPKPAPASAPALDAISPAGHAYFFRVAGTNRSLNKQVVFTGNLVSATNLTLVPPLTNALGVSRSVSGSLAEPAVRSPEPLRHARISGKAVIGNRKPVEINAVPTPP